MTRINGPVAAVLKGLNFSGSANAEQSGEAHERKSCAA